MFLVFACEHCEKRIRVDARSQGRRGRCGNCGQVMRIPRVEAPDRAPPTAPAPAPARGVGAPSRPPPPAPPPEIFRPPPVLEDPAPPEHHVYDEEPSRFDLIEEDDVSEAAVPAPPEVE